MRLIRTVLALTGFRPVAAGGGGEAAANALQLGGETLQLGGQDLTLGA